MVKLKHLSVREQSKEYCISSSTVTTSEDKTKYHGEAPVLHKLKKSTFLIHQKTLILSSH